MATLKAITRKIFHCRQVFISHLHTVCNVLALPVMLLQRCDHHLHHLLLQHGQSDHHNDDQGDLVTLADGGPDLEGPGQGSVHGIGVGNILIDTRSASIVSLLALISPGYLIIDQIVVS